MSLNEHNFQILRLTDDFYNTYLRTKYKVILEKNDRPYNCIIFEISSSYFVCITYKT